MSARAKELPVLSISLGDPGGIGPETILDSLSIFPPAIHQYAAIITGSTAVFEHPLVQKKLLNVNYETVTGKRPGRAGIYLDLDHKLTKGFVIGQDNAENGRASFDYINRALNYVHTGCADALVTGPISKTSFHLAGVPYSGHTSLLAEKTGTQTYNMGFHVQGLNVVLATLHTPLSGVPKLLTAERLRTTLKNTLLFARLLGIDNPRIALAGLNPHAGENGLFGTEELEILSPFVEAEVKRGTLISGPHSADTLFWRQRQGEFDIVIALYHDQGIIPVKLIGFDEAVNLSLGLPIIRTSPDHGTAFGIAYQGKASPNSMTSAIKLALKFVKNNASK